MRVIVHAIAARRFGGAARHLRGFLQALGDRTSDTEFLVFVSESFFGHVSDLTAHAGRDVTIRPVAIRSAAQRVYWDQVTLPKLARSQRSHAIWSVLGFGPAWNLSPARILNFQRTPTYYCPAHLATLRPRERSVTLLRRRLQYLGLREAYRVITPTRGMSAMVRSVYPQLPEGKFLTVPHAFDPTPLRTPASLPADIDALIPGHRGDEFRILYVGHILPYKGLDNLLTALSLARQRMGRPLRAYFTIAREDWAEGYCQFLKRSDELALTDVVTVLGKVPEHAVANLYSRADVLTFPSLCESFGWPVMEAMSLGLPILASTTPVNEEQAGDAALYHPPCDASATAELLVRLAADDNLRASLARAGQARAERISVTWHDYIRRCLMATAEPT